MFQIKKAPDFRGHNNIVDVIFWNVAGSLERPEMQKNVLRLNTTTQFDFIRCVLKKLLFIVAQWIYVK